MKSILTTLVLILAFSAFASAQGNNTKVTMCHKDSTITVDLSAVNTHLGHGDTFGECTTDPAEELVTICHGKHKGKRKKGPQTIEVPVSDVLGHLKHGDSLGSCD